jgi:hypothetical protein
MHLKSVKICIYWTYFNVILFKKKRFFGRCCDNFQVSSVFWGLFFNFSTRFLTLNNAFKKRKNMRLDIVFFVFFSILKNPFCFALENAYETINTDK